MKKKKKVLVFGGNGFLGSHFCNLNAKFFDILSPTHKEVDLLNYKQTKEYLDNCEASIIVNFVALANVNKSEEEKGSMQGLAYNLNTKVVDHLSKLCKNSGRYLLQLSTDCVFSGKKNNRPYHENDKPDPINWYGTTKYLGEDILQKSGCLYSIARVEMAYSADLNFKNKNDFARLFLTDLLDGKEIQAITNQKITPTYINDVAIALGELVKKSPLGIFHIASTDWVTPFDFATTLANAFGINTKLIKPIKFGSLKKRSPRPKNPWLDVKKFQAEFGSNILHSNKEGIRLFKKGFRFIKNV